MRSRLSIAVFFVVATVSALAAPLRSSVDQREMPMDGLLIITIQAQGTDFSDPVFEDTDDWRIGLSPIQQSKTYSVQIINGTINRLYTATMRFEAQPLREGKLVVPAVQMEIDGKIEKSAPIPVTVTGAGPSPRIGRNGNSRANTTATEEITFEDTVLLETNLSKINVFAGEGITLTVSLYELLHSGVRTRSLRPLTWPEAEGFYKGEVETLQEARVTRNGHEYLLRDFTQALYPTRPGTLTVGVSEWEGEVYASTPEGRVRRRVLKSSDPITLEVKPLPPAPPEFDGAVGRYQLSASIPRGTITQGIPFDCVVKVRGRGNPEAIPAPALPDLAWADTSVPASIVQPVGGSEDLEKVFTYSIVPTEVGEQVIPPISFTFFAPETSSYQTRETGPIKVAVMKSSESTAMVVAGGSTGADNMSPTGDDIRPIRTAVARLRPERAAPLRDATAVVVPPLLFLAGFTFTQRRRRFQEDTSYARAYFARSKSQKRLRAVRTAESPVEALSKALAGYLADKLDAVEAGLTSHDVDALLREAGVDESTRKAYVKVLRTCEREQYAAVKLRPDERAALMDAGEQALEDLMQALEGTRRKPA